MVPEKGEPLMAKYLVVVESPAKSKTIQKYLGADYEVAASVGHVRDLPKSKLGVDVEHDFVPEYVTIKGKEKVLRDLKKAAQGKETVFLGPDPDREGEAIAWHIREAIAGKKDGARFARVLFHEITRRGVTEAMKHPLALDLKKFESQQARRILDRLVGYQISPLLWDKVRRGLSAGRVQSVAVRMIVEREAEILAFVPREFWRMHVALAGPTPPNVAATLIKHAGAKIDIPDEATARAHKKAVLRESFVVQSVKRTERKRGPLPPFITSTLQQEAYRKLRFPAKRTMGLAQRLYEGVELGDRGLEGLITYMRTDSTRLAGDAVAEVRRHVAAQYGPEYVPEQPVFYRGRKSAQDAHEAIRPTDLSLPPEAVARFLEKDLLRLYDLIWKRFVACQMAPAVFDETTLDVAAGPYLFQAKGEIERFSGWQRAYTEGQEVREEKEFPTGALPEIAEGEKLLLVDVNVKQSFTRPRPRYTESTLIKEMEERGIGRPSTYAAIIGTIQDKQYARKDRGYFQPTTLGTAVTKLLVEAFPKILDVGFTARMEEELDQVEEGERQWLDLLRGFYGTFSGALASAKETMKNLKVEGQETGLACPKSGDPLVIKWGKNGEFLACSGYPKCRFTSNFRRTEDGAIEIVQAVPTDKVCAKCGKPMLLKEGRFGRFFACTGYPECKTTEPYTLMPCPKEGCTGRIAARRTKTGRTFYGCSRYPECDFTTWDAPVAEKCPDCGSPYLVEKQTRRGGPAEVRCPVKGCGYRKSTGGSAPEDAEADDADATSEDNYSEV
jgi:DNA topoisomerase-1